MKLAQSSRFLNWLYVFKGRVKLVARTFYRTDKPKVFISIGSLIVVSLAVFFGLSMLKPAAVNKTIDTIGKATGETIINGPDSEQAGSGTGGNSPTSNSNGAANKTPSKSTNTKPATTGSSGSTAGTSGSSGTTGSGSTGGTGGSTPPVVDSAYYVAITGNDNNTGNVSAPWRTIQKATSTAPAGATIKVKAGTYSSFTITKNNQVVSNNPGETVLVQGQAGVQDVIRITASGVTLSGMTVFGCVPNSAPAGFENNGSSGIRLHDGSANNTISGMTIRDSHGTNSEGRAFGCYAIMVHGASNSTITGNNMYHNGYGVFVKDGGQNIKILNNQIHDQDVIMRNTVASGEDFGAIAIGFMNNTASPGPLAQGNTIYNNVGPSHDYTTDGAAFEIFQASNITMTGNTIYNNEIVFESGANSGGVCGSNKFTSNTVSGKSAGSTLAHSPGLLLRCASNMLVDSNTITNVDWWTFDISGGGNFGASINGLIITNNTVTATGHAIYSMDVSPSGLGFNFNNNHFHYNASFGYDTSHNPIATLAAWRSTYGLDMASNTF